MLGNEDIVPVVMFHSVGRFGTDWVFAHLSEPLDVFEEKILFLSRAGYHFIFWDELYEHMAGRRKAPKKSIMLTFDDGYLDNWVYVFPILRNYGAKATIFINPDFVDHTPEVRQNLDDVKEGRVALSDLQTVGFLNWPEMRTMEISGLVDIQSHSLTHTWYYSGPVVKDFYCPGDKRHSWLCWNARPERKPYYMVENQNHFVQVGTPIYEHERALVCRRYFAPEYVRESMRAYVEEEGAEDFFRASDWKGKLLSLHASLMKEYGDKGRLESEEEYRKRVFFELAESKRLIEAHLDKRVKYICWPGGGYNDTVLSLAREVGYRAWTLASQDKSDFRNLPGVGPEQIKRVGSFARYQTPGGVNLGHAGGRYFICGIRRHKGSFYHTWLGRALLGFEYVRYRARLA